MRGFLREVFSFIRDLLYEFYTVLEYQPDGGLRTGLLGISKENFLLFLDKQVITGDFISINMTFRELFAYFGTLFISILLIILLIKFMFKLLGVFNFND